MCQAFFSSPGRQARVEGLSVGVPFFQSVVENVACSAVHVLVCNGQARGSCIVAHPCQVLQAAASKYYEVIPTREGTSQSEPAVAV